MKDFWFRILCNLFALNMWGLALVAPILFLAALLGLLGYLPEGMSLNMMGHTVESESDYYAFIASTTAFGVIGWIYVCLRATGKLEYSKKN